MARTSKPKHPEEPVEETEPAADATGSCGGAGGGVGGGKGLDNPSGSGGSDDPKDAKGPGSSGVKNPGGADDSGDPGSPGEARDADDSDGSGVSGDTGSPGEARNAGDSGGPAPTLQDELTAERDRYLRLAAEYDNFRKRSTKELKTAYSDARADTITRLLPVYDNLERALQMECSDEPFYKGVEMTMTQLTGILEGMGVVKIEAAGEPFDPNRHNAVASVDDPDLGEKIVAQEYQKGFILGERVIRFSTVVVAN